MAERALRENVTFELEAVKKLRSQRGVKQCKQQGHHFYLQTADEAIAVLNDCGVL